MSLSKSIEMAMAKRRKYTLLGLEKTKAVRTIDRGIGWRLSSLIHNTPKPSGEKLFLQDFGVNSDDEIFLQLVSGGIAELGELLYVVICPPDYKNLRCIRVAAGASTEYWVVCFIRDLLTK